MTILREKFKIPYYARLRGKNFANIFDGSKYWVTMDLFYDSSWSSDTVSRPIAIINPGAGVSGEYPIDASAVTHLIAKGIIVCVVYYYSESATDPDHTSQPPWYASWGAFRRNYNTFLTRRVVNLNTALEYIVDNFGSRKEFKADVTSIYLIGKSQGGATSLYWTYMCNTRDLSRDVSYYKNVKLIINNQGLVGSTTEGWYNSDRTITTLGKGIGMGLHPVISVYNDLDGSGGFDVAQRLRSAVTTDRIDMNYFVNFKDYGHSQDHTFNGNMILAWQASPGKTYYETTRNDGRKVTVATEGEIMRSTPLDYGNYRSQIV